MQKIIIMRGASGSGKTYYAQGICQQSGEEIYRVNREQLRKMVTGMRYYDKDEEKFIAQLESEIIYTCIEEGKSIIIDNTNLHDEQVQRYQGIAAQYNDDKEFIINNGDKIQTEIIDMRYVSLEVCLAQNEKRVGTNRVPNDVIKKQFERFNLPLKEKV